MIDDFIKENIKDFNNFGGDIDNLILNCKIVHGRRIFGKEDNLKRVITMEDIENGYKRLLEIKNKKEETKISHMYI